MTDLNPQVNQMADESMVRNLTAQIEAIWPQELPLYRRYGLGDDIANISGATLSCTHVTDGVRRIVAVVALARRGGGLP